MMLNQGLGGLNPLFQEGGPRSPAALAPVRILIREGLRWVVRPVHQRSEPRVASDIVERRVGVQVNQPTVALLKGPVQRLDGLAGIIETTYSSAIQERQVDAA